MQVKRYLIRAMDEEPYKSIYNIDTEKEELVYSSYGSFMDWLQSERRNNMEMKSNGMCSILNDECPEKKITDCRDCQLHCVFEEYRNRTYRMHSEVEE